MLVDATSEELRFAKIHYEKANKWFARVDLLSNEATFWDTPNPQSDILRDAAAFRFVTAVVNLNKGLGWDKDGIQRSGSTGYEYEPTDNVLLFKQIGTNLGKDWQYGRRVWAQHLKRARNNLSHDTGDLDTFNTLQSTLQSTKYKATKEALPVVIRQIRELLSSDTIRNEHHRI